MNFIKKIKSVSKKTWIIGLILLIGIVWFFGFRSANNKEQLFVVTADSLAVSGITMGGTVFASQDVNLSFQTTGRVSQVNFQSGDRVTQGQIIAQLDSSTISANIARAQADLLAEQAKLEEILYQETVTDSGVTTKRAQLLREMQNAYVVAEDAIMNKTDRFFDNPRTFFPKIFNLFNSGILRDQINTERYKIGLLLEEWQMFSNSLNSNFSDSDIVKVQENIRSVQRYLDLVASAVNQFEPQEENPLRTQAMVDMYKTNTSTARSSLNTALSNVIEKQETLRPTSSQIPFQEARIKAAQASILSLQADLEKTIIRAPFTGVITKQDARVGATAFSDQEIITMISDSNFSIEGFIPEIFISQISIGTKAQVTLNSYGTGEIFDATVSYVDPAASLRNGVASYKIELVFDTNDERIMVGMTGDVTLMTDTMSERYWIPSSTVISQGGGSYVRIKTRNGSELRKVEIDERTSDEVMVTFGLLVGDQIILEN